MGAELCLAHDMGGVEAYGGPLSVDMQPYGCFIFIILPLAKITITPSKGFTACWNLFRDSERDPKC